MLHPSPYSPNDLLLVTPFRLRLDLLAYSKHSPTSYTIFNPCWYWLPPLHPIRTEWILSGSIMCMYVYTFAIIIKYFLLETIEDAHVGKETLISQCLLQLVFYVLLMWHWPVRGLITFHICSLSFSIEWWSNSSIKVAGNYSKCWSCTNIKAIYGTQCDWSAFWIYILIITPSHCSFWQLYQQLTFFSFSLSAHCWTSELPMTINSSSHCVLFDPRSTMIDCLHV